MRTCTKPASYFWEGRKVRLRAMSESDTYAWLEDTRDSESRRLLDGIELPKTEADRVAFFDRFGEFRNSDDRIMFSIETLEGELVGGLNINSIDNRNGTFSVGSLIHRDHRGHGYFEEAKRIVLRYCFYELRLQKYNATTLENNEGMLRHFARIGAQPEGRRRRNVYSDGRFWDEVLYGLTREEFEENDNAWKKSDSP